MSWANRGTVSRLVALLAILLAGWLIVSAFVPPRAATAEDTGVAGSPVYETTDAMTGASVIVAASSDEDGDQCLDVEVFQMAVDAPSGSFGGCGFAGAVDTATSTDPCYVLDRQTGRNCPMPPPTLELGSIAGSTAIEDSPDAPRIAGALVAVACACQVTLHFSDGTSVLAAALPSAVAERIGAPFVQFGYRSVHPGVKVDNIDVVSPDLGIGESRTFHLNAPRTGSTAVPIS